MTLIAALHVGPIQFETPVWLWLIPILGALTVWMARKSLSGLGGATRWVSLAVRLLVIALLAAALAEPSWRKESKAVAVTMVLDASESIPTAAQHQAIKFVETAIQSKRPEDEVGLVTAAKDAYVLRRK